MALDIKKGAGEYRVVRPTLFLMVRAAYAPAGGCEIKCFGIKFEAGRDAEVVSTIEKAPWACTQTVRLGSFFMGGLILIGKFRDRPGCGGGSGHKKESGRVQSSTSHSLFDGHGCICASRGM